MRGGRLASSGAAARRSRKRCVQAGSSSQSVLEPERMMSQPCAAAQSSDVWLWTASQMGGCGCCSGRGNTVIGVPDGEVLPVEGEVVGGPGQAHHFELFFEECPALVLVDVEAAELQRLIATAQADFQAAVGQQVGDGDVFGQSQRVPERGDDDGLTKAHAGRTGARSRDEQQRIRGIAVVREVVLGDPDGVEAKLIGERDMRQRFAEPLGRRRHRRTADQMKRPEAHAGSTVLRRGRTRSNDDAPGKQASER